MIFLLDTANLQDIASLIEVYPLCGVTTNPTIVARSKTPVEDLLRQIRSLIGPGRMLHAQALGDTSREIVTQACRLRDAAGSEFYIKVPVNAPGFQAIPILKKMGFQVTATAVFTPLQGLLAARAGADFVAPYVNRLDKVSANGVEVVSAIVTLFSRYNLPARVLSASFKNVDQVLRVALAGSHAATIEPSLFTSLLSHPLLDQAVSDFNRDGGPFYSAVTG